MKMSMAPFSWGTPSLFAPEVMRMVERIIVVCGGILCVYLGYLLFHIAVLKQESSGKFKSAVFEFTATKVGPGVFFALFGAYILCGSLNHPISTGIALLDRSAFQAPIATPDAAVAKLTDLAKKLPTPEDREAAEAALKNLRTTFSGNSFWGSTPSSPDSGWVAMAPPKQ
jgi:hypothetical protein